jgi:alpha-mannosidase
MQITRLYKGREHVEVEFIVSEADGCLILTSSFFTRFYLQYLPSQVGPIPIEDGIGKEVATQITTTMETNKTFYTDSNGRDFIKRVKCCYVYLLHLAMWCGAVQLEMHLG